MSAKKRVLLSVAWITLASVNALAQTYAPAPPAILNNKEKPASAPASNLAQAATQYSVGDPTDEEQLHLELINRARADASAEAQRLIALSLTISDIGSQFTYWQVDTNLMKAQFATNPPAAPLSFNAKLIESARGHSQFQFDNAIQTHTGTNGSTLADRVKAAGYLYANAGENVYANAKSVEQGHAAFDVDWGPGPGGMQTPPGHRNSIHNQIFQEIGIGIVDGFNTVAGITVGPQVITEDFGRPQSATTFITGVAYYDLNGNNFYDLGEGLPDVTVTIDGVSTFAVTSHSGAYSIPVPPNHTYTVRFNATGLTETAQTVSVTANNTKLDFKPTYVASTVASGPSSPFVGVNNLYTVAALPNATGYRARIAKVLAVPIADAEGDLSDLTFTTFGNYPVVSTTVVADGAKSFHLGQMVDNGALDPQVMELNDRIYVLPNAHIDFKSKMAIAGTGQFASLDVSEDDGVTWTTLWTQFGVGQTEEPQFSNKSVSLAAYESKTIRVRLVFDVNGSGYILPDPGNSGFDHVGWFFDDVQVVNGFSLLNVTESPVFNQPQFAFNPAETGSYLLQFQPIVGSRTFPYATAKQLQSQPAPPTVSISKTIIATPTSVTMQFTAETTALFSLESADSVNGPWSADTTATITGPGSGGAFTVTIPRNGPIRFYRIAGTF